MPAFPDRHVLGMLASSLVQDVDMLNWRQASRLIKCLERVMRTPGTYNHPHFPSSVLRRPSLSPTHTLTHLNTHHPHQFPTTVKPCPAVPTRSELAVEVGVLLDWMTPVSSV